MREGLLEAEVGVVWCGGCVRESAYAYYTIIYNTILSAAANK